VKKDPQDEFNKSKLSTPVKKLIELIFDINMMNKHMLEIGYDVSRMPLGKLSKDNIMKGYKILQELINEIKGKDNGKKIQQLTNDFYSYIPHNVGFTKMQNFKLDDEKKVKQKI
jgi:poly [ADP-ribose] polymerase